MRGARSGSTGAWLRRVNSQSPGAGDTSVISIGWAAEAAADIGYFDACAEQNCTRP